MINNTLSLAEPGQSLVKNAQIEAVENVGDHEWSGRPTMKALIARMINYDPAQRPDCLEILHKVISK